MFTYLFKKNLVAVLFSFFVATSVFGAKEGFESTEAKEIVTPQSQLLAAGTFGTLSSINAELEESIRNNASLKQEKRTKLLSLCDSISNTISTTVGMAQSASTMTVSTAQFIFSVKGCLTLAVLGCLSQYILGSDFIFSHGVLPVSEKFSSYLVYLIGNIARSIGIGLKTPLEECLNSQECNQQVQALITQVTVVVGQATASVAGGVSQGFFDFAWNSPGQALTVAATAATYGVFNLAQLVVPAFVLAKVGAGR